jgi:site-specific recombinase XerD
LEYEEGMNCELRRLGSIVYELETHGDYTVDDIMSRYRSVMSGNSVGAYAEHLAVELEQGGYDRTARAYRTAAARLIGWSGSDVKLEHITAAVMNDFQQSLKSQRRSMNTISFYMRTLRAIYNKAVAEGRLRRTVDNPFAGVYTGIAPTRKLALTSNQLARLSEFDPTVARAPTAGETPLRKMGVGMDVGVVSGHCAGGSADEMPLRMVSAGKAPVPSMPTADARCPYDFPLSQPLLQQSLAMFLFCCHARGMCFVDMAHLKKSDVRGDTVRYRRKKTGRHIELRLLPSMRRIIEWFAPLTAGSEYLFPVIIDPHKSPRLQYESGLRVQNRRLKQIAAVLNISKPVSTHTARHSWATVAKNAGFPLAVISEGLGHSSQRTTQIYLASLEQSVLDSASRVVSDAIGVYRSAKPARGKKRGSDVGAGDGFGGGYGAGGFGERFGGGFALPPEGRGYGIRQSGGFR